MVGRSSAEAVTPRAAAGGSRTDATPTSWLRRLAAVRAPELPWNPDLARADGMRCDHLVFAPRRWTLAFLVLPLVSVLACVGGDEVPAVAGTIDEPASFQLYRLDEGWGPCGVDAPGACSRHVVVGRDGAVEGADQGAAFAGQLTAAELDAFVALVIGEPVLTELLDDKPCFAHPHYGELVTIGLAPGLRLQQITTSCGGGPIETMNIAARAIARRFSEQTSAPPATGRVAPSVAGGRLRFQPQLFSLVRTWAPAGCVGGASCESTMSVGTNNDHAGLRLEGRSRNWLDVDDFAPLAAVAVSPEVISTLRKPSPCPDAGGARDRWRIGISRSGMVVEADVAGCLEGPVAQLRAAASALFDRLAASTDPSADASADHPPDLRGPAPDGGTSQ
jgi:hypothetical protein